MAKEPFQYDRGWGWVVVLGSFLIHMICDGITYSFGVILVDLEESFQGSNFLNSWIVSILIGFTLGSGPIAGAFANRFSCRSVSIVGAIVASFGSFISAWAANIPHLIITVGVIMGSGFGLMFCPSVLIVNMYFEKKRAVAIGIAVCGAGVGTFVFSPLSEYLMDLWGWRGCFIVYSGIILNGVVCASVFRPVVITHVVDLGTPVAEHKASQHQNGLNNGKTKEPSPILEEPETEENTTLLNGGNSHHTSLRVLNHLSYKRPQLLNQICTASDSKLKTVGRTVPDEVILPKRYRSETFCVGTPTFTEKQAVRRHVNGHDQIEYAVRLKPFELKDIFLSGSLTNLPNQQQLSHPHTVYHRADSSTMVPTNEIVDAVELSQPQKASVWAELRTGMAEMTDFSILRDPVYLLFAVSNFLTNIGYDLPRVFLPTYAQPFNISKSDSPWLVSAWGIANTIGRVFVGWLADQRWAMPHRLWIYNFSLVICGIVNFCAPLCRDFPSLLVYSILFGFTLSTYISLTSVVLVDLLGLEKLTSAYGLLLFFQGVAAVVGTPMGGLIMDATGVQSGFIFAGAVLAISGLMLFPIPCIRRSLGRSVVSDTENGGSKPKAVLH